MKPPVFIIIKEKITKVLDKTPLLIILLLFFIVKEGEMPLRGKNMESFSKIFLCEQFLDLEECLYYNHRIMKNREMKICIFQKILNTLV